MAEIGPELVVTATVNEMPCAGSRTVGSGWVRGADASDGPPEWALGPAVLCRLGELAEATGRDEAGDDTGTCLGVPWSWSSDAAFGRVMDAAMMTAAPTTPAKRTLRVATTTS